MEQYTSTQTLPEQTRFHKPRISLLQEGVRPTLCSRRNESPPWTKMRIACSASMCHSARVLTTLMATRAYVWLSRAPHVTTMSAAHHSAPQLELPSVTASYLNTHWQMKCTSISGTTLIKRAGGCRPSSAIATLRAPQHQIVLTFTPQRTSEYRLRCCRRTVKRVKKRADITKIDLDLSGSLA